MCTTSAFSLGNRGGRNPLGDVRKIKKPGYLLEMGGRRKKALSKTQIIISKYVAIYLSVYESLSFIKL